MSHVWQKCFIYPLDFHQVRTLRRRGRLDVNLPNGPTASRPTASIRLPPMTVSPPLLAEAASRLANIASMGNIRVVHLSANLDNDEFNAPGSLSWRLKDPTFVWEYDKSALVAFMPFEITITFRTEDNGLEHTVGVINVAYRAQYSLKEEPASEEDIPHFVGISGFLHVWPYLRAEVQSLTAKLGLPSLTLPVLVSGHAAQKVTLERARDIIPPEMAAESDR